MIKISLMIVALAAGVAAQSTTARCTVKEPPTVRQLKLRMSKPDVESLIGKPADRWLLKRDLAGVPGFDGVDALHFRLYEGKLAEIFIRYEADTQPTDIKQFARRFSDDSALPFGAWDFRDSNAVMMCDGFVLFVNSQNLSIKLIDTDAVDAERKKNKDAKDPEPQNFKP